MTWKWWLNSELRRTLLGFSEALSVQHSAVSGPPRGNAPRSIELSVDGSVLSYGGKKIAREGYAPRSRCRPGALLLRHGRKCTAVRRTTASGLSPDRTELRTRCLRYFAFAVVLRTEKWRSTRESHSGRVKAQLFSGQFPVYADVLRESGSRVGSHLHALRHLITVRLGYCFRTPGKCCARQLKSPRQDLHHCDYVIRITFWIC